MLSTSIDLQLCLVVIFTIQTSVSTTITVVSTVKTHEGQTAQCKVVHFEVRHPSCVELKLLRVLSAVNHNYIVVIDCTLHP
jgi:hypothetical protein